MTRMISYAEADTITIAQDLASTLKPDDVVFLRGDLGVGKTVFARALIRALCGDDGIEVVSPTFTLVQIYDGMAGPIHHYDLYRIEDAEEIFAIGWEDSLGAALTIVEWPDRLGAYMPRSYLDIEITNVENESDHRAITIKQV